MTLCDGFCSSRTILEEYFEKTEQNKRKCHSKYNSSVIFRKIVTKTLIKIVIDTQVQFYFFSECTCCTAVEMDSFDVDFRCPGGIEVTHRHDIITKCQCYASECLP